RMKSGDSTPPTSTLEDLPARLDRELVGFIRMRKLLVIGGDGTFVDRCRESAEMLGASFTQTSVAEATASATKLLPRALVVADEVHAFDPAGFRALAARVDAALVVVAQDMPPRSIMSTIVHALREHRARDLRRA